jgi:hypothetical protein
VVIVTAVFENLARIAARAQGRPEMRCHVLPHPMESRPEADVRQIARDRADAVLDLLIGSAD